MVSRSQPPPEFTAETTNAHIREALWEIDLALMEAEDEGLRGALQEARAKLWRLVWSGALPHVRGARPAGV